MSVGILDKRLMPRKKSMTSGNVLTKRMKRNIRKLRYGERIFIENINAELPDKITRQLDSIVLKVK